MKTKILQSLDSPKNVFARINELDLKFREEHKKSPKVNIVYSEGGSIKNPTYNLAIWYTNENLSELEWFVNNTSK